MSMNDHGSPMDIEFGVTHQFQWIGKSGNNEHWPYSSFDSICIFRDVSSTCGWAVGKQLGFFKLHHVGECSFMVNCLLSFLGSEQPNVGLVGQSQLQAEPENEQDCTLGKGKSRGAPNTVTLKCSAGVGEKVSDEEPLRGSMDSARHQPAVSWKGWALRSCLFLSFFFFPVTGCLGQK